MTSLIDSPNVTDSCDGLYQTFRALDFLSPVVGALFDRSRTATQGMPLGGIGTGCLDIAPNGTLGFATIFNSHVPRRGPINLPFMGVFAGEKLWVLSTQRFIGFDVPGQHSYRTSGQVRFADDIVYWGHYPMVDMDYQTDAPLDMKLRAWSPFVPGDTESSSTPIAVFDLTLTNRSHERIEGSAVFSFPGPTDQEAGGLPAEHREFTTAGVRGLQVRCAAGDYVLAVVDHDDISVGGGLGLDGGQWRQAATALPTPAGSAGASVSVPYSLDPGGSLELSFLLSWFFPEWFAAGNPDPVALGTQHGYQNVVSSRAWSQQQSPNTYQHMYATRFNDGADVIEYFAPQRELLRSRVIAWQSVVFDDTTLPAWLKDGLINSLHLITETSLWASARAPIGSWCQQADGLFGMNEDPRNCPQIECVPCSFYGNYPLVYFFPQLALSTLRGYKAYQYPDGEVAWIFGGMTADPPSYPIEMSRPDRGYQAALNSSCVVDMVFRYWKCTGDLEVLHELYDMVKQSTIFTMSLRSEDGAAGVISFPAGNSGLDWFEACSWAGMAAHLGGIHLAQLRQAVVIAETVGDDEFSTRCREWLSGGAAAMEELMWTGTHYRNYWDRSTGESSDLVMANQLDGQWMVRLAGLESVFDPARMEIVLDTVERTCIRGHAFGAVNFADDAGRATTSGEGRPGWNYNPNAYFVPENIMLAATYLYAGRDDLGMEIARRCWMNLVDAGLLWDQPNLLNAKTGEAIYGNDYYQNMIIWSLPAAIAKGDVAAPLREGGLIQRILCAARSSNL
ncbi:MAG TPA: GH116 family glycosyl hydrolase [Dermatophilaceae bacterium]